MNRDVNVIINATAGTGWPPQRVEALRSKFSAVGLQAEIELINGGDDLLATVRRVVQSGASTVVAGGGDGTVSTVASCLVESGIVLGVLPMGALNHFAKDLRIPLGLDEAVANIATGGVRAVDVGEVNRRTFINNSSLGLYPTSCASANGASGGSVTANGGQCCRPASPLYAATRCCRYGPNSKDRFTNDEPLLSLSATIRTSCKVSRSANARRWMAACWRYT